MNSILNETLLFFKDNVLPTIFVECFILLLLTFLITFVFKIIFSRIKNLFKQNSFAWYLEITNTLEKPLYNSLWIFSITFIIESLSAHPKLSLSLIHNIKSFIPNIRNITIIIIIANALLQAINKFDINLVPVSKKNSYKIDKTTIDILSKLFKAIIFIIAGLTIIQNFGMNISGVLALGGISGLTLGFASKDLLSNFFGTIMIYLDKPFIIGEFIKIDGKGGIGMVEKVDWRMTIIRTEEKKQLFIPNSIFLSATIENSSRISHKTFAETIKIICSEYTQIIPLITYIKDYLKSHKQIDNQQEINVEIGEITQNIIKIKIKGYSKHTNSSEFSEFRNNLLIEVADMVKNHQLNLAPLYKEELF